MIEITTENTLDMARQLNITPTRGCLEKCARGIICKFYGLEPTLDIFPMATALGIPWENLAALEMGFEGQTDSEHCICYNKGFISNRVAKQLVKNPCYAVGKEIGETFGGN